MKICREKKVFWEFLHGNRWGVSHLAFGYKGPWEIQGIDHGQTTQSIQQFGCAVCATGEENLKKKEVL